jgi:hypothetical protein
MVTIVWSPPAPAGLGRTISEVMAGVIVAIPPTSLRCDKMPY